MIEYVKLELKFGWHTSAWNPLWSSKITFCPTF